MVKLSYALGLGIGRQLSQMGAEDLNIDDFAQAIKDIIAGNDLQVTDQEAQSIVTEFFQQQEAKQRAAAAEKYKDNKDKGEAWLAEKAMEDGVVTLPSGLMYQVLNEGTGKKPTAADTVECHYEGRLIDGTVFDSSYSVARALHSHLTALVQDGQRVCSLCQSVQSIASSSLTSLLMASVALVRPSHHLQHSCSTLSLSRCSNKRLVAFKSYKRRNKTHNNL